MNLKQHVPNSHPVMLWLAEHTSLVLNKFKLGADGLTAYERLNGKQTRQRICEFGEVVMWYVPVRLRGKLDARWRYGLFFGRATDSDQNIIALKHGNIVRARAMVRVVEGARWSMDRINVIQMSPTQARDRESPRQQT